jgi:hypothetical protein
VSDCIPNGSQDQTEKTEALQEEEEECIPYKQYELQRIYNNIIFVTGLAQKCTACSKEVDMITVHILRSHFFSSASTNCLKNKRPKSYTTKVHIVRVNSSVITLSL